MHRLTTSSIFESIKRIDEKGNEYWYARELMNALDYKKWQKFVNVINNAKDACYNSNNAIDDHFTHLGKMIDLPTPERSIKEIEKSNKDKSL